jgi:hypothetical protein
MLVGWFSWDFRDLCGKVIIVITFFFYHQEAASAEREQNKKSTEDLLEEHKQEIMTLNDEREREAAVSILFC